MRISITSNKYINHYVNHYSVFAICFGTGNYIQIGFSINNFVNRKCLEIMFFYWRIFINV